MRGREGGGGGGRGRGICMCGLLWPTQDLERLRRDVCSAKTRVVLVTVERPVYLYNVLNFRVSILTLSHMMLIRALFLFVGCPVSMQPGLDGCSFFSPPECMHWKYRKPSQILHPHSM